MMLDRNEYQKELLSSIGEIGRTSPEIVRGYRGLADAGEKTGHLDAKIRELIALAVAVSLRCDGCITIHTSAAIKAGATQGDRRSPWRRNCHQCRRRTGIFFARPRRVSRQDVGGVPGLAR